MLSEDLNFNENPYTVLNVNINTDDQTILAAFESSQQTPREEHAYRLIKDHPARLRYALLLPLPINEETLFQTGSHTSPIYRSPGFWYDAVTSLNKKVVSSV